VLIIDEALATGDMAFTAKSYARVRQIVRSGTTVLFVSHSLASVYELCDRAILLEGGVIAAEGEPRKVGYQYEDQIQRELAAANNSPVPVTTVGQTASPDQAARSRILGARFLDQAGRPVHRLRHGERYVLQIEAAFDQAAPDYSIGYNIRTEVGTILYGTSTALHGLAMAAAAGERRSFAFSFDCRLNTGTYMVTAGIAEQHGGAEQHSNYSMMHLYNDCTLFEVTTDTTFAGLVNLDSRLLDPARAEGTA
jgi:hypothetical protein